MDALLKSYASAGNPRSVLVGVSGGADSVALLVSLCELRREHELTLFAVHVNHGLRKNATLDEAFCKKLCSMLDVPLICKKVEIPGKSNVEAEARKVRYAAFREAMASTQAEMLALAHHLDDQAETVVMHLLYGAGASGLGGMRENRMALWRPFLQLRRAEVQQYLLELGYSWREDESNADTAFTRNRIRVQIMPALEACAPEAVRAIGRTAEIVQAEDDYLNQLADEWIANNASKSRFAFLLVEPLCQQHLALQRRILRRYALIRGIDIDFRLTESLRAMLEGKKGAIENLPDDWHAFRSKTRLHFFCDRLPAACVQGKLSVDEVSGSSASLYSQPLPQSQLHDLQLRTRRPGDFIHPFGMKGKKSLKEYMIDHSVDRPFRDAWPLICRGSEVLWVIGIGASEKLRVSDRDMPAHRLIFSGLLPDHL